uniref:ubiquitinyl hydrolase 1 n=1 Tax=Romanomermis culicivorax TaxID=13658 RepID=A0A915K8E1_ROMCU
MYFWGDFDVLAFSQNKLGSEGRIARNLAVLIAALWLGRYKYVSPSDFKYTIGSLAVEFANYDQKDAQELLIFVLNGLHEDLNRISHKVAIPDQTETNIENFDQTADKSWKNFLANDRSIIIENFYGQFGSVTKCCHCSNASFIFEAFMSLTLPVVATNGKCTLNDCIDKFLSFERLTSDCSKCLASREIYKTMLFRRLPKYLIIHFN